MAADHIEKPAQVTRAVAFLWAALIIRLVTPLIEEQEIRAMGVPDSTIFLIGALALAVTAFFIFMISGGRNWARIIYLVLLVLFLPFVLLLVYVELLVTPVIGIARAVPVCLEFAAMYLVFTSPGDNWFRRKRK